MRFIIQTRIGANARERQANLDYSFKQMINAIFPAMHRYLLHAATYEYDVFDNEINAQTLLDVSRGTWTE
jgi:hypothetical protein